MGTREGIVIGCFKDMGSESVVCPPVLKAHSEGYRCNLLVEGKGGQRFVRHYMPYFGDEDFSTFRFPLYADIDPDTCGRNMEVVIGSDDFEKRPFQFCAEESLSQIMDTRTGKETHSVVLIGESHPINIERHIALSVRSLNQYRGARNKIKLVVCQDFWGSSVVCAPDIIPDCVHCNDEYAAELTLATYRHLSEKDIVIRGNPGVKRVVVSDRVSRQYDELWDVDRRVYFYAGAGEPETSAELSLLQQCLAQTPGDWRLVVGFHPVSVEEHGAKWRSLLAGFGDHVVEAKPGTGDEWGTIAPVTISGASTIMTTAAYAGNIAISLRTPEIVEIIAKHNMREVPQVAMGWAHSVSVACDLSQFGKPSPQAIEKLQPFDVEKAYESIVQLLER